MVGAMRVIYSITKDKRKERTRKEAVNPPTVASYVISQKKKNPLIN